MTPTELELIAARDHDAMARFYDRHVAMVGEFCAAVCPDERVDEAVAAVFLNFLGRVTAVPQDDEPEALLRRAAREIAASRMEAGGVSVDERGHPICRAMPELLAARVNGELPGHAGPLTEHLVGCPTCQAAAARLGQADVMFPVGSAGGVTELRAEWLQLAGDANTAADAQPQSSASAVTSSPPRGPPGATISDRDPPLQPPIRGRVRRGGLVGAVKRLTGAPDAEPRGRSLPDDARN